MTSPALEQATQVRLTEAFIATRPVRLVLIPMVLASDGTGGKKKTPARPRHPQQMRFVEDTTSRRVTETGTQYVQAATILAMPDASIAVDDEFEWLGNRWRVEELMFPNNYEIRAVVLRYGR